MIKPHRLIKSIAFAVILLNFFSCAHAQINKPIVIQGAMNCEIDKLVVRLKNSRQEKIGPWIFWRGTLNGHPVIISKTLIGAANAAAATSLAILKYHPAAIINQGTAGGLVRSLHLSDIVIGDTAINLMAFSTQFHELGKGSNSLEWKPMKLAESESTLGDDPNAIKIQRFAADKKLLFAALRARESHHSGKIVVGTIGSSEVWDNELDRIHYFNKKFSASVEDMETASAAQVASEFHIPFIGIRVISDNITNGEKYKKSTGALSQEFVFAMTKIYLHD